MTADAFHERHWSLFGFLHLHCLVHPARRVLPVELVDLQRVFLNAAKIFEQIH